MENPDNRVMYYLAGPIGTLHSGDGPESALGHLRPGSSGSMALTPQRIFVSEELMLIPEDTELPPDYVQEW